MPNFKPHNKGCTDAREVLMRNLIHEKQQLPKKKKTTDEKKTYITARIRRLLKDVVADATYGAPRHRFKLEALKYLGDKKA